MWKLRLSVLDTNYSYYLSKLHNFIATGNKKTYFLVGGLYIYRQVSGHCGFHAKFTGGPNVSVLTCVKLCISSVIISSSTTGEKRGL